ncbi:response regulator receiver domain [Mesorhizobium sp. C386A]|uniref:response regulator receiver domain n=1 Tax=unclassified Mesorhizobium TaxID=325217 RepID=UPI0003CF76C1|nr:MULTISPECIES: response regulator receiver domain [unclassified Mesorhizobium]ESY09606.1 hypothetical protein X752_19175 [Mesorhizobium sp. LNJC398B00]ESY37724.1 hypothetical protein X748_07155 [Mesorhizobium sp. LNJC386A00]ESZ57507.1 hypothetical protein X728_23445 [Mesorhizobium sp. L103C120A0]WJI48210.1 response regulator receiver domain [Mesorhizobium sp. C120A]
MKHKSIGALRQAAVESFVRTAILIDNEPAIAKAPTGEPAMVAKSAAYGANQGEAVPLPAEIGEPPAAAEPAAKESHRLWVQPVTNGFASRRITCGFYFPANDDPGVVETALNAARYVDATIVDWQLRPKDTGPARELITRLIKDDEGVGGRLRLVVVYTGERGIDGECAKLLMHLQGQGLTDLVSHDEGRALAGKNVLITFANKPRAVKPEDELTGAGARPISWEKLPAFVLEQYSFLAKGLLQSFALKGIGAVRDDTHHLLSVFDVSLDSAYLAQRAGIGSPSDAEDMMTSLLTSEFSCSILDRGITKEILGPLGAVHALSARTPAATLTVKKYNDPQRLYEGVVVAPQNGKATISTTANSLGKLVKIGLDSQMVPLTREDLIKLQEQFFQDDDHAKASMSAFARMGSFVREADGQRRLAKDAIHLTGGVLVRSITGKGANRREKYLLCVQPGCDAVRLTETTAFPFCTLVLDEKKFDLLLRVDGVDKPFRMNRLPRDLVMMSFAPDTTRKVVTVKKNGKKLRFTSVDNVFWEFVAELRQPENQHFTTLLVGKFNRVALNGSEWLRLQGPA